VKRKRRILIEGAAPTPGELLLRRIAEALAAGRLPRAADRRAFVAAVGQLTPGADLAKALCLSRGKGAPRLTENERFARHYVPVTTVLTLMESGSTKDHALEAASRCHGIRRSYLEGIYKRHAAAVRKKFTFDPPLTRWDKK
jgi:hypothetical protein